MPDTVPFNRPFTTGQEADLIREALDNGVLSGNGPFGRRCEAWLESAVGTKRALLATSCTSALEMAALLLDLEPGDEVIMPSYTFVTTATSFVRAGAVPVFVDIRPDTLNIDPDAVARAVTARTKAIVPVHYAGVGCEMERLLEIADAHGLTVVEDAAQGAMADRRGVPLGSAGALAAVSFHETKNLTCGEGGALYINDERYIERAEVLREKGTNRSAFFRGAVDKYTWVDTGSSYVLSELNAAYLWAQLLDAQSITDARLSAWSRYHEAFADLERAGVVRRPHIPSDCRHNAHMYYLVARSGDERDALLASLRERGIGAVFHYIPLHSSPAGRKVGRADGDLAVTDAISAELLRLPLFTAITPAEVDTVIEAVRDFFDGRGA